ncbi:MAG TPA: Fic family protein [Xanthobacteraceae bacterium]|jgi:Fic family protein|nr:Fic family protein [Xanthobacteraceae bacterium]
MLTALIRDIEQKKAQLERLRPVSGGALAQLQKYYDIELTYTSNAIEGNTLTHRETAEVIEHGVTVGGKSLRDHLEAVDHYEAVQWMRGLAAQTTPLGEDTVCELHRRIVARSQPAFAGIYSPHPRRIAGSPVIFPNPLKIPQLMEEFGAWLSSASSTPEGAFEGHFRLTAIHPFTDGNGRTARLLMNLMLIRGGYPPIAVRPEDRKTYLDALERGSLTDDLRPFRSFLHERLDATLAEYLSALQEALPKPDSNRQPNPKEPTPRG